MKKLTVLAIAFLLLPAFSADAAGSLHRKHARRNQPEGPSGRVRAGAVTPAGDAAADRRPTRSGPNVRAILASVPLVRHPATSGSLTAVEVAGCWPHGRAGRSGAPPHAGHCRDLAAARRRAGGGFRAVGLRQPGPSLLERLRAWVRAEAGAGRLLPWVPVAFGAGIALYFTASHEPVLGRSRRCGGRALRRRLPAAAEPVLCRRRDDRRRRGGLCHRDGEDRARRPHRAGAAALFGLAVGLCRDARHPRAHRPFRAARDRDGRAALFRKARAGAAVGARRAPRPMSAASSS